MAQDKTIDDRPAKLSSGYMQRQAKEFYDQRTGSLADRVGKKDRDKEARHAGATRRARHGHKYRGRKRD